MNFFDLHLKIDNDKAVEVKKVYDSGKTNSSEVTNFLEDIFERYNSAISYKVSVFNGTKVSESDDPKKSNIPEMFILQRFIEWDYTKVQFQTYLSSCIHTINIVDIEIDNKDVISLDVPLGEDDESCMVDSIASEMNLSHPKYTEENKNQILDKIEEAARIFSKNSKIDTCGVTAVIVSSAVSIGIEKKELLEMFKPYNFVEKEFVNSTYDYALKNGLTSEKDIAKYLRVYEASLSRTFRTFNKTLREVKNE